MKSARQDIDIFINYLVYKSVFVIYPAAPVTAEISDKRFGLSCSAISVSFNIFYQRVYFFQGISVLGLPANIIDPAIFGKIFIHRVHRLIYVNEHFHFQAVFLIPSASCNFPYFPLYIYFP